MEPEIYKKYIKLEVIQRIIMFAKTYGINIIAWNSRGPAKNPTRIYLFKDQDRAEMAGFVDYNDYNEFPLVLFSPIGKIEGHLYPNQNIIRYGLNVVGKDNYDRIDGFYTVKPSTFVTSSPKEYFASSKLMIKKGANLLYTFNCMNAGESFYLESFPEEESLSYKTGKAFSIWHFKGLEGQKRKVVAAITQDPYRFGGIYTEQQGSIRCTFPSSDVIGYTLPNNNLEETKKHITGSLNSVNFTQINGEIAKHDPCLFDFIDKSRKVLTLEELALYDNLIASTFKDQDPIVTEGIARIPYQEFTIGDNPLVLNLDNQKKRGL